MATDPERPDEGAWSDLDLGFFAAAPPDVPVPPPEPMRFDDLDPIAPIAPPRPEWRARLGRAWAATGVTAREARMRVARLKAALRSRSGDRPLIAAAAAALLIVTGISAGVVASRGGGRMKPSDVRLAVGGGVVCEAAPVPTDPMIVSEREAPPSAGSIAPEPAPRPHRKHKHAKGPVRRSVRTKPALASPR